MNNQRDFVTIAVVIVSLMAVLAILVFFITQLLNKFHNDEHNAATYERQQASIEARIAKVGRVVTETPVASASQQTQGARSSAEIVASVCNSCHTSGVLGAPRLDQPDAWRPRVAQGMNTLVAHAINGYKQMPARGGDTSLSDSEVRAAVEYMLEEVGVKPSQTQTAANTQVNGAAQATTHAEAGDSSESQTATVAATEPEARTSFDALEQKSTSGAAEPAQALATSQQSDTTNATPSGGAERASLQAGEALYNQVCHACHRIGAAGAPKIGDQEAWQQRLEKGRQTLYQSVLNGKGAMPAKGGAMTATDAEVRAAVEYILARLAQEE